MSKIIQTTLFFTVALVVPGCGRKTSGLHELEANAAATIYRALDRHEAAHPNVEVTNLTQIFDPAITELGRWHILHPAFLETEFRNFGKLAGFTNSFYEKYVRVPPGVTNRAFPKDPIFMNAQPVPDRNGGYGRYVIWREAPQYHRSTFAPESQILEAFQRAGVPIPKPSPMPKPPRPEGSPYPEHSLGTRVELFFKELSGEYGPGRQFWFPVMLIFLGGPLVLAITVFVWFTRRTRKE